MHSKFWGSLARCLTAALMLAGLAVSLVPSTVYAAGYEEAALWLEGTVAADYVDGVVDQNRRTPYIKTEQYVPQWQQADPTGRARMGGALDTGSLVRTPETLEVSELELDMLWRCPLVKDTYVSSPFGMRRHPVYGYRRMHNGVDLDSDRGDLVVAARGGVVVESGYNSSAGRYVRIDHGDGFETVYYHLTKRYAEEGQRIAGGEPVGTVGRTGVATGSHLHFGVMLNGEWVDPEDYVNFD